ncbi:hypothetical protein [Clostridium sp.]|uniref:hypothetical protein n=1 Tax=Clostridium sp. TaxID=1506 RepID=UPI0025B8C47D|nr:hypothetical protein [Clostridium sp.]MCI1800186.1 hypothetical protein [Clostridium sp.]MCI2200181.1 hypothetical protein [Clostridium sp.]
MSHPEIIKIGGIDYNIRLVDTCDEDDLNIDGKIIFDKQEIRIKKGLEKQYGESILLHEIIHGIFEFCGWEQNEENVTRLSNALYQVLRDNNIFK